jgi:hypothetical protein
MLSLKIIVTIAIALGFYVLRCRRQLVYGVFEIIVAFAVVYLAYKPPYTFIIAGPASPFGEQLQHYYGIIGGVYLFVRGMDNIGTGLPSGGRARWDRVFRGHTAG